MRIRHGTTALVAALALTAGDPAPVDAQTDVRVRASVGWDSGRIGVEYDSRDHRPYYGDGYHVHYPDHGPRYDRRARRVRIPPGHRPRAGMCRAWFPGTPPGHQPPPRPCDEFYWYGVPYGAMLVGPGGHPGAHDGRKGPPAWAGPQGHGGHPDMWKGGKKKRKGKGRRGRGPGR